MPKGVKSTYERIKANLSSRLPGSNETSSTSSPSGASRNPALEGGQGTELSVDTQDRGRATNPPPLDKNTKLLVLPKYQDGDKYMITTRAGPREGVYSVAPHAHHLQESQYHAYKLALPVETCGELMQKADFNHQDHPKVRDDELDKLRDKLKASEDREKALLMEKGQYLMSVAGGHDYNSPFPSPNELTKRVNSFHEGMFADVMDEMEHFEHSVTKNVLVFTVKKCYDLAQYRVKERLDALDKFLLGEHLAKNSHDTKKPACVKDIASGAFKKVHQDMFGQFYPSEGAPSVLIGEVKDEVVKRAESSIPASLSSLTSFIENRVYEVCIMKLLQTFLECELTRPKPLRFSDSFGAKRQWDSSLHIDVDPSSETEGKTYVQVILPGLYLAEGVNDTEPKKFETKPVVIRCESSASAGCDESRTV